MATFPTGIKSFSSKVNAQVIEPSHINDLQDEATAIETFLRSSLFNAVTSAGLLTASSYTPVFTSVGVAAALGNGTATGTYWKIGKFVLFNLAIVFGSTSTFGTGAFIVTLPSQASTTGAIAAGQAIDSSAGLYYGLTAPIYGPSAGVSIVPMHTTASNAGITAAAPFTWATSDSIQLAGFYQEA